MWYRSCYYAEKFTAFGPTSGDAEAEQVDYVAP